jgi:Ni,Fe-hydrogenase maturation factor
MNSAERKMGILVTISETYVFQYQRMNHFTDIRYILHLLVANIHLSFRVCLLRLSIL